MKKILFTILLFTGINFSSNAQEFGFGCLGFVGGYGGFSYQVYDPKGLNDYITFYNNNHSDSLTQSMSSFGKAQGFRVGLNFFRANLEGLILTAKGFYQSIGEKHEAKENLTSGDASITYDLKLNNWGVGVDLGTSISTNLSWKVIDAALLFNTAIFTSTQNYPNAVTELKKYKSESILGYTIGTGFIYAIIDEYVTLEGVAAYTVFSVEQMQTSDGEFLTVNENSSNAMQNFIEAGGFNAVIQINIGFPL